MSARMDFDAVVVGEELGPVTYRTDAATAADYARDWDDSNPLYVEGSALGSPLLPPAHMAGLACFALIARRYDASGTLNAESEHENLKAVPVGETLTVRGRITEKFVRRGLEYIVVQSEMYDAVGDLVRRSLDHLVLSLDRREA